MNSAMITTRAIHFAACLILLGIWTFDRFVANAVTRRSDPTLAAAWQRIARWLSAIALLLTLLSGAAWFALVAVDMNGLSSITQLHASSLSPVWNETDFGTVWKIRTLLWIITAAVTVGAIIRRGSSLFSWAALLASAGLVGSLAGAGHAMADGAANSHFVADVVHLLAAGVWPAGLLPLACLLLSLRHLPAPAKVLPMSELVRRFSNVSIAAVAILAVTGLVNTLYLLQSPSDFLFTRYGNVLLVKICLFIAMLAVGAVNLLRVRPHIGESTDDPAKITTLGRKLRRNVFVELALFTLIILAVAMLGRLPPPP